MQLRLMGGGAGVWESQSLGARPRGPLGNDGPVISMALNFLEEKGD